jgi:N12 class adenine-specific DNA methylase
MSGNVFNEFASVQAVREYDRANPIGLPPLEQVAPPVAPAAPARPIDPTAPASDTRRPAEAGAGNMPPPALMPLFEAAAARHGVPVNVIMALAEQESGYNPRAVGTPTQWGRARGIMQYLDSTAQGLGINPYDPAQAIDGAALQLRQRLDRGESMEDAIRHHFAGPNRALWGPRTQRYGEEVVARAARLADQLGDRYAPRPAAAPETVASQDAGAPATPGAGQLAEDAGRLFAGDAIRGGGSIVRGAGAALQLLNDYTTTPLSNLVTGRNDRTPNLADPLADRIQAFGATLKAGVSPETQRAIAESTPDGDLFDPSTWTFGRAPSALGYAALGVGLFGSMAPVVVAGMVSGPGAAALVGGAQGGGGGVETAREIITEMAGRQVERDGWRGTALEAESPFYRALRARGMTHEQATQRTADAAERYAFTLAAPVAGAGGAATAVILNPASRIAGRSSLPGRVAARAGLGAVEEGTQEAAETVAARTGTNIGAGTSINVTEGTFGDAVLGAMAGGSTGAAGGAMSRREPPAEEAPRPGLRIGLPPRSGPRAIEGPEPTPGPDPDGLALPWPDGPRPASATPDVIPMPGPGGPAPVAEPPPAGPLTRALGQQAATSMNAGAEVLIEVEGLDPIPGTVEYETPEGVMVRTEEGALLVAAEDIRTGAARVTPVQPAASGAAPVAPGVPAAEGPEPAVGPVAGAAAPQSAPQMATSPLPSAPPVPDSRGDDRAPRPPELAPPQPGFVPPPPAAGFDYAGATEPELRERLRFLAAQGKAANGGWTPMLTAERKKTEAAINRLTAAAKPAVAAPAGPKPVAAPKPAAALAPPVPKPAKPAQATPPAVIALPGATAPATPSADPAAWWGSDLTDEGRRRVMAAAGVKKSPRVTWAALTDETRAKLLAAASAVDEPAGVTPPAPNVTTPAATTPKPASEAAPPPANVTTPAGNVTTPAPLGEVMTPNAIASIGEGSPPRARPISDMRKLAAEWDKLGDGERAKQVRARIKAGGVNEAAVDAERSAIDAEKERRTKRAAPAMVDKAPDVVVAIQGADALVKVLADIARRAPVSLTQDGTRTVARVKGQVIATLAERPAGTDPLVKALGTALAEAMKAEGRTMPSNPEDMSRNEFAIAYQFGRIIPEFELDAEMMASGVIQDAGTGLTVNLDKLYDAIQRQKDARKPAVTAPEPAASAPVPPKASAAPAADTNTIFTADAAEKARAILRAKLSGGQLNTGIDPEIMQAGITLAGYHIEKGARSFAAYSKAMLDDMGEMVRPYLKSWYLGVKFDPRAAAFEGMSGAGEVEAAATDAVAADPAPEPMDTAPEAQEDADNAGPSVRVDGAETLGGMAPEDGEGDAGGGNAEPASAGSEQGSGPAGSRPDGGRVPKARSGGSGAAGVDPAAAGSVAGPKPKKPRAKKGTSQPELAVSPSEAIQQASPVNVPAIDFAIDDSLQLGRGTEGAKYQDNLAAIRTLKQIEAEGRRASPDEQRILARYVGWGGLKNAFRVAGAKDGAGVAKGWEKRVAEIEELLTPPELKAARNSTTAAHYTSQAVVQAMWKAAERLGFRGGAVLEPSVGTGNFLGLMPEGLRGRSRTFAVEYDSLTARIASLLYPNATIVHSGFQSVPLPTNQFALAIGNPPFGRESLFFRYKPEVNGKSIHNQFFLASLASVRPGGIMAMVVSHNLMDALDPSSRLSLAAGAEFVGGIRLPDTAFKENARTEVVTDMLFFRKRTTEDAEMAATAVEAMRTGTDPKETTPRWQEIKRGIEAWTASSTIADPAGSGENINANPYFLRNPGMVIGKINATGTMNARADLNVTLDDPAKFLPMLDAAVSRLPEADPMEDAADASLRHFELMADAMRLAVNRVEVGAINRTADGVLRMVVDTDGGDLGKSILREIDLTADTPFNEEYTLRVDGKWEMTSTVDGPDGKPAKVLDTEGKPTKANLKVTTVFENLADIPARHRWGADRIALVSDLLPIKNLMKRQLVLESQDAPARMLDGNRAKLNEAYDRFVEKHGPLHGAKVAKIALMMPDGGLAMAAEVSAGSKTAPSYAKAPIMSRRVTAPPQRQDRASNASDAVAIVLGERGFIDLPRIAELLDTDEDGAAKALAAGESPRAFYDPETNQWEPSDLYLSGLVRRKLHAARAAGLEQNVKALEAVIPADWDTSQITPNPGSAWIPGQVYADFMQHLGYTNAKVAYSAATNSFTVSYGGKPSPQWETGPRAHDTGTIFTRMLNSQGQRVTVTDSDGKPQYDEVGTVESQQKASELFNEFLDWVYRDDGRRAELVRIFNEKFNTRLVRQRDGSHLTLPGKVPDAVIKMRRHQMNGIWRGITDPAVLYDHVVGAGKTFTAIARIMERRRMGLSNKPLVVVPNHLVEQWRSDVAALYPGANVLAAGKADFERKNRRRLFARIASGDFDMVIIGHSSFGFIDLDPATEERYLLEELQAAQEAVKEAEEQAAEDGHQGWGKPFGVAEAERLVAKLEARLARLRGGKRDRLLTFEEMGVDDLTVDEAHEFKNLSYSSRLTGVAGMGNKTGSQKAMDLHLKVRSLRERKGTSVAFLTGTPISNSVAEMYLILRNLAPAEMKEMGLENFDAWRTMFVSAAAAYEPTESGSVKEVTRLGREWMNMKSLMDLYYSVSDAVTIEDIKKAFAEDNPGQKFPVPEVASARAGKGDRAMVAVKPTPEQRAVLADVVDGFKALPEIKNPKERNIERLKLMDKARKIALDPRAVDPRAIVTSKGGKIRAVVENVARIHKKWAADRGTQIVFLDRSVPAAKGDGAILAAYDDLRDRLKKALDAKDDAAEARVMDDLAKYDANEMEALRFAQAGGWNAYDEMKRQMVAEGIPADEIRFIQEANTDEQKKALFALVKAGKVRVLIGSTPRLGAGTNVQDLLVALHHVDVTWKPSDIEQREGRIVRQGNRLLAKYGDEFDVEVLAYATEMTVDAKMWSLNAAKLKAINGIRKYDGSFQMEFEDEESASMAEMAALATGNPLMVERVTLDGDIKKLEMQQRSYSNRINAFRDKVASNKRLIARAPGDAAANNAFADLVEAGGEAASDASSKRNITVQGKVYRDRTEARLAALSAVSMIRGDDEKARFSIEVGGEKVTSQEQINAKIRDALGTPNFQGEFGGVAFIHEYEMAKAITAAINGRDTPNFTLDGATINGVPVEFDVRQSGKTTYVDASAMGDGGRSMAETQVSYDGPLANSMGISGLVERLLNRLDPAQYRANARYATRTAAEAEKETPGILAELEKPWPKKDELEAKRARQTEVLAALTDASFTDELSRQAAQDADIGDVSLSVPDADPAGVLGRIPELQAAAQGVKDGTVTAARYAELVQQFKPVRPYASVPKPATVADMRGGLTSDKVERVGVPAASLAAGDPVGLRLDIPAYANNGVWVVSVHEQKAGFGAGASIGYEAVAAIDNASFGVVENAALNIAAGKPKATIAVMKGEWQPIAPAEAEARAREALADPEWVQVGMDPTRHSYFYDRATMEPVVSAAEAIQIGPLVLARRPVYGAKEDYRFNAPAGWGEVEANDSLTPEALAALGDILRVIAGPEAVLEAGRTGGADGIAAGPLVRLSMSLGEDRANWVTGHEAIHTLRNLGRITDAEWAILTDAAAREGWGERFGTTRRYRNRSAEVQAEEAVAEAFAAWATGNLDGRGPVARIFQRIRSFLQRLRNALAGRGFRDRESVFQAIRRGEMGQRAPGSAAPTRTGTATTAEISAALDRRVDAGVFTQDKEGLIHLSLPPEKRAEQDGKLRAFLRDVVERAQPAVLATVPLRPLLEEVAGYLPSAARFLRTKQAMDSLRSKWFATSADLSNRWLGYRSSNKAENAALMDLMHESTLSGIDPSKSTAAPELRKRYLALSKEGRALYAEVRDTYSELADAFDAALMENVSDAVMARAKRAERLHKREVERIEGSRMTPAQKAEARERADKVLKREQTITRMNRGARMMQLRRQFESNRLKGPYFPLARFGDFYVVARDAAGEVVSYSLFEKPSAQRAFARQMEAAGYAVKMDRVSNDKGGLRSQVDPRFVAEVEGLLQGANAPADLQDQIWQRFLQRMPDLSIRTSRIHRKGTAGFDRDAIRAFGHHMFHGAHQLARLNHAQELQGHVDAAREEAAASGKVNAATAVVNEMQNRMDFIMNPTGGALAHHLTSAAFVYHLSASPAAALVNLSQIAVLGVPILAATKGGSVSAASAALIRAVKDVAMGKGSAERAPDLTSDERALMREIYEIGLADRTQAHDLAGVAETGVAYNNTRHKVMSVLSFAYHHAERMNREATALAAYRMQRKAGMDHAAAMEEANRLTWKIHFDYQNTSRPRVMQNDTAKVLLVFRNFTVNMLFRLFRDTHQMVRGESAEVRREARMQLIGTTMMMAATAGIRGVWGYGIAMTLAGMFFGAGVDEEDELRKWMQRNLGNTAAAILLDGLPGYGLGISLSERVGMPDLWFRSSDRLLEGKEAFWYWVGQGLGALFGIADNVQRGVRMAMDDNILRGIETAMPKAIKDMMRAGRFATEGATTLRGDALLESVPTADIIRQAAGFTPARLAEIYGQNTSAQNAVKEIADERSKLLTRYYRATRADDLAEMRRLETSIDRFNDDHPDAAIMPRDLVQSMRQRERVSGETVNGLRLPPRQDQGIRERLPARTYN